MDKINKTTMLVGITIGIAVAHILVTLIDKLPYLYGGIVVVVLLSVLGWVYFYKID